MDKNTHTTDLTDNNGDTLNRTQKTNKPVHAGGPQSRPSRALAETGGKPPPLTPPPNPTVYASGSNNSEIEIASQNRIKTHKIRVTSSEDRQMHDNMPPGQKFTVWAREILLRPSANRTRTIDPSLVREVAKIGNNINQIARSINSANARGTSIEIIVVAEHLHAIRMQLSRLIDRGLK